MSVTFSKNEVYELSENDKQTIEDCPPRIEERLQRANFTKDDTAQNRYVKRYTRGSEDDGVQFLSVQIERTDDGTRSLHLSSNDSVGVTHLTPTCRVTVTPDIPWEEVLQMLATVSAAERATEFREIDLTDKLEDDLSAIDLYPILAVNLSQALAPVFREGVEREILVQREERQEPRGDIDVSRQVQSVEQVPKTHHCIFTEADYETPLNELLYAAGVHLLELYREDKNSTASYGHTDETLRELRPVFVRLREQMRTLEDYGVSYNKETVASSLEALPELPKQRPYYANAVQVAQTVLQTTFSVGSGQDRLLVDYLIPMNQLFEDYVETVLRRSVQELQDMYDPKDIFREVTVRKRSVTPLPSHPDRKHKPDHVIEYGGEVLAVLDSKYMAIDPSKERKYRNQLFGYGYLFEPDRLGFVTPTERRAHHLSIQGERAVDTIHVLGVDSGQFSTDEFEKRLSEYVYELARESDAIPYNRVYDLRDRLEELECVGLESPSFAQVMRESYTASRFDEALADYYEPFADRFDRRRLAENVHWEAADTSSEQTILPPYIDVDGQEVLLCKTRQRPSGDLSWEELTFDIRQNYISTNPAELPGHNEEEVVFWPYRATHMDIIHDENVLGFMRINTDDHDPSYVALYVDKEIRWVCRVQDWVTGEEVYDVFDASPLKYTGDGYDAPVTERDVAVFRPQDVYQLENPILYDGEAYTQRMQYSNLGALRQATTVDEFLSGDYDSAGTGTFWEQVEDRVGIERTKNSVQFQDDRTDAEDYVAFIRFMFSQGYLTVDDLPVESGHKRYMIHTEPKHKDGSEMYLPKEPIDGVYVETHSNSDTKRARVVELAERFAGHDISDDHRRSLPDFVEDE